MASDNGKIFGVVGPLSRELLVVLSFFRVFPLIPLIPLVPWFGFIPCYAQE